MLVRVKIFEFCKLEVVEESLSRAVFSFRVLPITTGGAMT